MAVQAFTLKMVYRMIETAIAVGLSFCAGVLISRLFVSSELDNARYQRDYWIELATERDSELHRLKIKYDNALTQIKGYQSIIRECDSKPRNTVQAPESMQLCNCANGCEKQCGVICQSAAWGLT